MKYILIVLATNLALGASWIFLTFCFLRWRFYDTGNCPICGLRDRLHGLEEDP